MSIRDLHARILPTPFVSSFVGRARPDDRHDPDPERRASAWARWAVDSLEEFRGLSDREYVGLVLPGKFHDVGRNSPPVRPHLEIPRRILDAPDPEFPDRLSQAGNGLEFPWWVMSEVTAVRRAIFNGPRNPVAGLLDEVNSYRHSLAAAVDDLNVTAGRSWALIEEKLVAAPHELVRLAVDDFSTADIAAFFPPAAALSLRICYDSQLRESGGEWAVRRIGVWQLQFTGSSGPASLGVVTPRLTRNSLFVDDLFAPTLEAPAALLVRGLLLRRLSEGVLNIARSATLRRDPLAPATGGPHLRAIVARPGAKLPEASIEAAVHFLQQFPEDEQAWNALQRWAGDTYLLTVSREGFAAAHRNALRFLRRAETPDRDDVNLLLPLAWDDRSRVVRVTFSKPASTD